LIIQAGIQAELSFFGLNLCKIYISVIKMRTTGFLFLMLLLFSCSKRDENKQAPDIKKSLGWHYYKKAQIFKKDHQFDKAYYYYQLSEKKALKQKDSFLLSKVYLSKAIIDYMYRDLPSSENYCVKALQILPENHQDYKKNIYNILGVIAIEKKNYALAINYFLKYKQNYRNEKDTLFHYIAYHNNTSNAYRHQKQYSKALIHLDSILSIQDTIRTKYPKKLARAMDNKAHILIKMNQLKQARQLLDSSYKIRQQINDIPGLIQSHLNYARYFNQIHQKEKAHYHSSKALKLSLENKIPENQLESYENLIRLSLPESNDYFEKYVNLNDSILYEQQKGKEQTALIRYESLEKEKQIEAQKYLINQKNLKNKWLTSVLLLVTLALFIFALQTYKIRKKNIIINRQNQELTDKNKIITVQNKELTRKNQIISRQYQDLDKNNTLLQNVYKDMHHRIKNNLDVIIFYFINPVLNKLNQPEMHLTLSELKEKIVSLRNLHIALLNDKPNINVPLKFIVPVIKYIQNSLTLPGKEVQFMVNFDENIKILYKQAYPVILIINEFVTNSYKYAFDNTPHPIINISITQTNGYIKLVLKDNGKGFPENINFDETESKGLNLIQSLVTELEGQLIYRNNNGLEFEITFLKKSH